MGGNIIRNDTRFRRKGGAVCVMDTKRLNTPLVIFTNRANGFSLVCTVAEASNFLFDNWSENDSEQWTDAMNQCAGVDLGITSVEDAGLSFILAVRGAGMRVRHLPCPDIQFAPL
ncbi:DUF982 domain-containing protein, partial [Rhizobiaceae sp. 2RAB30]